MDYNEFMNQILESDLQDWVYDDSKGKYVLKSNILISITSGEINYGEDGIFHEEWAESFSDPEARVSKYELRYCGDDIETFYTAMVDGARMYIPYPKREGMTITQKQYAIGKIINIPTEGYDFDSYLRSAGITVEG